MTAVWCSHKHVKRVKGIGANDWDLFVINCWRTTLQLYRDTVSLVLWGFTNVLMGILFGTLFYQSVSPHTAFDSMLLAPSGPA